MKTFDEIMWAFLDGEMTASEFSQHAHSLSREDRLLYSREFLLEHALGEVLSTPVTCPPNAWKHAMENIQARQKADRKTAWLRQKRKYLWLSLPLAALLVASFGANFFFRGRTNEPELNLFSQPSLLLENFQPQANDNISEVRSFMEQWDLPVMLDPADDFDGQDSPYRILGARADVYQNEDVIQLLFDHKGSRAGLVIVKNGGMAAKQIGDAVGNGSVRAMRSIGDVMVAAIGAYVPQNLTHIINDEWPMENENQEEIEETPPDTLYSPESVMEPDESSKNYNQQHSQEVFPFQEISSLPETSDGAQPLPGITT